LSNSFALSRRIGEICRVFGRLYWSAFAPRRKARSLSVPQKAQLFRKSLEELGSVFVKFGQFLSMRPEFLPWEYCDELFALLEDVPPFSSAEVEQVFRAEFGKPPEQIFRKFGKTPFASASLGQVHLAWLNTGEKVAVKVQRPGIREAIVGDLQIMRFCARIFQPFLGLKILPVLREFERWIFEELDYVQEIECSQKFFQETKAYEYLMRVPKTFPRFSSRKILTAEFIPGKTLNKILADERQRKSIQMSQKVSTKHRFIAKLLIKNFLPQFFLLGFFHADPHPANIILTPDRKLAFIDFGVMGKLDERLRVIAMRFARSVLYGDKETAFDAYLAYNDVSKVPNMTVFRNECYAQIERYQELFRQNEKLPGQKHFLGKFFIDGVRVSEKHKGIIPMEILKFFRAMAMFESIVFYIDPTMTVRELGRKLRNFSLVLMLQKIPDLFTEKNMEKSLNALLSFVEKEFLRSENL